MPAARTNFGHGMINATNQLALGQARSIRLAKPSIHIPGRSLAVQLLLVVVLAWPLVSGQAGSPGENKSIIHFKNGDWLRGSLEIGRAHV